MARGTDLKQPFAIALGAGVFLGLLGPFGMGPVPIGVRVAYWTAAISGGTAVALVVSTGVAGLIDREGRRPYLVALVTALAMTAPASAVIALLTGLFFPRANPFGGWVELGGAVLLVSLGMTGVNALAHRTPAATPDGAPPPVEPAPRPTRFLERLPLRLRGAAIEAVESEDHYLRIHTDRGSDLILMRLADAIVELEGLEGAQTHRSWWVAKAAVRDVRRGDGRATLILASGAEAPVSRSYLPALRDAGWF